MRPALHCAVHLSFVLPGKFGMFTMSHMYERGVLRLSSTQTLWSMPTTWRTREKVMAKLWFMSFGWIELSTRKTHSFFRMGIGISFPVNAVAILDSMCHWVSVPWNCCPWSCWNLFRSWLICTWKCLRSQILVVNFSLVSCETCRPRFERAASEDLHFPHKSLDRWILQGHMPMLPVSRPVSILRTPTQGCTILSACAASKASQASIDTAPSSWHRCYQAHASDFQGRWKLLTTLGFPGLPSDVGYPAGGFPSCKHTYAQQSKTDPIDLNGT